MSKEAMKLACKALMDCHYYMINAGLPNQSLLNEAFTAYMELEAALAKQPAQQEPVALPEKIYEFVPTPEPAKWHHPECEGECIACLIERVVQEAYGSQGLSYLQRHLTSSPAQQEPVAWQYRDARDDGTWGAWIGCDKRLAEDEYRQVRALYASPQPAPVQQEPAAVVSGYYGGQCVILPTDPARIYNSNTPLYTAPQPCPTCEALARTVMLDQTSHDAQRKPLMNEEIYALWEAAPWKSLHAAIKVFARAIEAAHGIGEKNT